MISKGANDWNRGLYGACTSGHKEMIELMISKGSDNWNLGLYGAYRYGHKELIEYMISKGAKDLNSGLYSKDLDRNKEIRLMLIIYGADINCYKLDLSDNDFLYLLKKGLKKFGKYIKQIFKLEEQLEQQQLLLNQYVCDDLSQLIIKY